MSDLPSAQDATPPAARGANRFDVHATSESHFSWLRTRLSLERTLMSWLRTATALIGFGFAIVQYIHHLTDVTHARPAFLPGAPEYLGLALIGCGIVALVVAIWQYQWMLRYLWSDSFASIAGVARNGMNWPVVSVAIVLVFVGLFAFFAVLLRTI